MLKCTYNVAKDVLNEPTAKTRRQELHPVADPEYGNAPFDQGLFEGRANRLRDVGLSGCLTVTRRVDIKPTACYNQQSTSAR